MKATFGDKRSKKYDDNIKKHDSIYEKMIDRTKLLLNNADLVLDFACAFGEMSLDIAPHVQRVHGIDQSIMAQSLVNRPYGITYWLSWASDSKRTHPERMNQFYMCN